MLPKITLITVNSGDYHVPPLGLASIATYLTEKKVIKEKSLQILDQAIEKNVLPKIKKFKPDIIGISSMTQFYPQAIKLAKRIKTKYKKIPLVIGGIQITLKPQSFDDCFDVGVIGEGEETFLELVSHFKKNGSLQRSQLKKIPGLVFHEKDKLIQTPVRELISPLDKIPIPNWNFFSPYLRYYYKGSEPSGSKKTHRSGCLMTSRGCPFRCLFCSTSVFWKKPRYYSAKRVADEIEYLIKKFGINRITIQDDIFNFSKKRLKEIVKEMEKRKLLGKSEFGTNLRADFIDEEFCQLFKKMGGTYAFLGFESGSEKILKFLKNKTVTVKDNQKAVKLLNKYQFAIHGGIIFGSPGETKKDMEKSIQFMKWFSKFKYASRLHPYILTPYPGTKIWEIALQKGLISNKMKDWEKLDFVSSQQFFPTKVDKSNFAKIYKRAMDISNKIRLSSYVRLKTED